MTNQRVEVLDKGYVELWDMMGSDLTIVNAARTSYLGESKGLERDKKLLRYLYEHQHLTPFEQVTFQFKVKCPLFVARQWMRHRTQSYNEVSRRYTSEELDFYYPDEWRLQAKNNKQASDGIFTHVNGVMFDDAFHEHMQRSIDLYDKMIGSGIAREMARMVLPQNMYTVFVTTVNARNLMHFMALRLDSHSQHEMRLYAGALLALFESALPWTAELFDHEHVI